jgi:hypothetical protein
MSAKAKDYKVQYRLELENDLFLELETTPGQIEQDWGIT